MQKKLISGLPLDINDLARLALEISESMGTRMAGLPHADLMSLLRRVIREDVRSVEAAENTVSFAYAAQKSLEARQDRRPSTKRDLRHYIRRMLRDSAAAECPLRSWSVRDCRNLLEKTFGNSPSSY